MCNLLSSITVLMRAIMSVFTNLRPLSLESILKLQIKLLECNNYLFLNAKESSIRA
jgi:hypothetical protein